MWIGPLHDTDFVDKMLQHADSAEAKYETLQRIKGMITLARNVGSCIIGTGRRRLINVW